MQNRLYSVPDAADLLGTSKDLVYKLIKHGHLQVLKLGRLKISAAEINDFIERNAGKDLTDPANILPIDKEIHTG